MASNRLYGLDALRGVAAILVVYGHLQHIAKSVWLPFNYGLSVDFFLMLSGYVMARTYEGRMRAGLAAWPFLKARFRRLWPVMTIGALLGFAVTIARDGWSIHALPSLAALLLFLPYPFRGGWLYPYNGPSWSISNELLANFVHAAVLARMNAPQLILLVLAATAGFSWYVVDTGIWPAGGWPNQFLPAIARTFMSYIIGILLFRQFGQGARVHVRLSVLVAALVIFVLWTAFLPAWAHILFIFVVSPLLVLAGANCELTPAATRWAIASGAISFPLYAVHYPLLEVSLIVMRPAVAATVATLLLAGIVGWLALRREPGTPAPA